MDIHHGKMRPTDETGIGFELNSHIFPVLNTISDSTTNLMELENEV